MTTTYLFPSTLRGLADVSVSPGAPQNGYPLVWNNTTGKWEASLLPYSSLSGAPALPIPVASGGTGTQTGSITGTGALTFASSANGDITLSPNGTGKTVINKRLEVVLESATANAGQGISLKKGNGYFSVSNAASQPNDFVIVFQGKIDPAQGDKDQCIIFDSLYPGTANPTAGITAFIAKDSLAADPNFTPLPDNKMCFAFWNSISGYGQANPAGLLFRIFGNGNATLKGLMVIRSTEASTSTTTGALQVAGGIGAQGNLIVGGTRINFANLPTSSTGLAVGDLWRDGDDVKVKL